MNLRPYQQRAIDDLYHWWVAHPGHGASPLLVLPTGAGKSVVIAELVRLLWDTWPEDKPRTVVIVPSKELAEQNAAKLRAMLPGHLTVGYYSAAIGQKRPDADVIVATIGSVYKAAHLLGNIKTVLIDEAHLVNPEGVGRYRQFLGELARLCTFRVVGLTATPFRGNGIWLTDGDDPLFTGVACTVRAGELLDAGHLAPLVRPADALTLIDTDGISTTGGDFNTEQLGLRVEQYIAQCAQQTAHMARDRRAWIAFTPTVANAHQFAVELARHGISADVVTGDTPKAEREASIAEFRAQRVRCLVTVLALATGFDVPAVDCIAWLRPTRSPVLYVQGAGRGMRPAEGKTDCLWLDFTGTTARMGPVDEIRGKAKPTKPAEPGSPPHRICPECGERVPVAATECPSCGEVMPEPERLYAAAHASDAQVMAHGMPLLVRYAVSDVRYSLHRKEGKPDSMRVDYFAGLRRVACEYVCFEHGGFAGAKAAAWWARRTNLNAPDTTAEALHWVRNAYVERPTAIAVNEQGRWPEIAAFEWTAEETADEPAAV